MAIGDEWDVLWPSTGRWERAKVVKEAGGNLELQLTDAPDLPDLANKISATADRLQDQRIFRRPIHSKSGAWLFEIEIGRSYKCDRKGGQYVATVKEKQDGRIGVALHNVAESVSDPGQLTDSRGLIWLKPENIHPL